MQQQRQREQMRLELQHLQVTMNEYFTEQERMMRVMYNGMRDRLDKLQTALSAANGADAAPYADHATPVYARYGAARHAFSRPAVPSTPPAEARSSRAASAAPADRSDWASLTLSSRAEGTPAVSPHRAWAEEVPALANGRHASVDLNCLEPLDRMMNDDDTPREEGKGGRAELIPMSAFGALQQQHLTTSVKVSYQRGRPKALPIADGAADDPERLGIDVRARCKVLVEFKRKRVLQFESKEYVPPGSYVMVGGDRGEDLGLVTYAWCEATPPEQSGGNSHANSNGANGGVKATVLGVGLSGSTHTRSIGLGTGTVLRLATKADVEQLHEVQTELERRAIDVCSQRVLERGLPMTIVDAEYQFDKNKLTFFYEAQQRMDFRELVRDLYKTFRARIWMELVEN